MKLPNIPRLILEQVEQEVGDEWSAQREIGVFRASEMGDCPRQIQYTVQGKPREKTPPELALLFRDGHLHHDALRDLMKRVGRVTNVEQAGYKQYNVQIPGGDNVKFILTATMDLLFNGEFVIDIKSINHFSFQYLTRDYIVKKYRGYMYQIQGYMDIFDKPYGALLFKNKMTGALKIFWYRRNPHVLNRALIKLGKIHQAQLAGKMIKRPFKKSSKECKQCFMRIHCWKKPMERRRWK